MFSELKEKVNLESLSGELYNLLKDEKISKENMYLFIKNFLIPLIINLLSEEERRIYLENNPEDSKNGTYPRTMLFSNFPLQIKIPRTRKPGFYPSFIPKYSRSLSAEDYENLMYNTIIGTRSIESLKLSLRGLGISTKELMIKAENYLQFLKFPKAIRGKIKSTNQSENLHKELEKIRFLTGGYFQSEEILFAKWNQTCPI